MVDVGRSNSAHTARQFQVVEQAWGCVDTTTVDHFSLTGMAAKSPGSHEVCANITTPACMRVVLRLLVTAWMSILIPSIFELLCSM